MRPDAEYANLLEFKEEVANFDTKHFGIKVGNFTDFKVMFSVNI